MKLYYYKDIKGNFGDDLNPWLWSRLIPELFDSNEDEIFVGIGTLINNKLPEKPIKHIFGSGFGYGDQPIVNDKFIFHAVRGFETAKILGLPEKKVISDAAVLIRTVHKIGAREIKYKFGFIPTGETNENFEWEPICNTLGFKFISCHSNVDEVLDGISQCETMICEAMHGAIVADALRVPWIPVSCNKNILSFKWRDWLSSNKMSYLPNTVLPIYGRTNSKNLYLSKDSVKRSLYKLGIFSDLWSIPPPARSTPKEIDRAIKDIVAASVSQPQLSDDWLVDSHIYRFLELLELFRKNCRI